MNVDNCSVLSMSDEREMAVDKSSYFSHAFKYFLS